MSVPVRLVLAALAAALVAAPEHLSGQAPPPPLPVANINFTAPAVPINGIEDVAAVDLDFDGDLDLVCAYRTYPAAAAVVTIVQNPAPAPFGPTLATNTTFTLTVAPAGALAVDIAVGDVNSDTLPDIVAYAAAAPAGPPSAFNAYLNFGGPLGPWITSPLAAVPLGGIDDIAVHDFDGDGSNDVTVLVPGLPFAGPGVDTLNVYTNGGAGTFPMVVLATATLGVSSFLNPAELAVGNFDGGGGANDDILVRAGPLGATVVQAFASNASLIYPGGLLFSPASFVFPTGAASGIAMGIFTGVGLSDAAVYFPGNSAFSPATGFAGLPAPPPFGPPTVAPNQSGGSAVMTTGILGPPGSTVVDVVSGDNAGNVCFYLGTGTGAFNLGLPTPLCFGTPGAVQQVVVADVGGPTAANDVILATTSNSLALWLQ